MRSLFAALALFVASPASAALNAYYCWAPDAASGKVFMSEVRSGGVPDRVAFAPKWGAWLKSSGRAQGDVRPICTMRESTDQVERARSALAVETCPECGSAREFVDAPMAGSAPSRLPLKQVEVTIRHETGPKAVNSLFIVWGNIETGRIVRAQGGDDTERRVARKAYANKQIGWAPLIESRTPGFGAAMCLRDKKRFRFFAVHPRASFRDALDEAKRRATAAGRASGQTPFVCGGWYANDSTGRPTDPTVIDLIRGGIRLMVTSRGLAGQCVDRAGFIRLRNGSGRCAIEFVRSGGNGGVRG